MKILFWGTPEFAVPALRALLGEGHEVVSVVTQPDRPAGRGRTLRPSPVKRLALDEMLPVLQPERAREEAFLAALRELEPELSVVVAYGQILSRAVLDVPALGSINVHASLLPELRGAAPIAHAIMAGHALTGITIMRMVEAMDAGPILHQVSEPIGEEETATELAARLSEIGAEALIEALAMLDLGELEPRPQEDAAASYAPRLNRESAHIHWGRDAAAVARHVRAMDELPGAWALWREQELKLYRPALAPVDETHGSTGEPGTILRVAPTDPSRGALVACANGALWVREVKPQGRRRMTTAEWLRGRGFAVGDRLS